MSVAFIEVLLVMAAAIFGLWLLVKVISGTGWLIGRIFHLVGATMGRVGGFVGGMVRDVLRLVGGIITAACFVPAILLNVGFGRWSRANHYGKALEHEALGIASALYRVGIGHIARLLGLRSLTDGIERRLPEVMARAPGPDVPSGGRSKSFEGYAIVGSLPSGGSGARLFLAEPDEARRVVLARTGMPVPRQVVIKSFSLGEGSTMPQIVRESRALEAARQLGLVLEHELSSTRFHYVMPYVPGDDLSVTTQRLHDEAGPDGLAARQVQKVMSYVADLLHIMHRFHTHGLWHKDIKPSNIIVSEGRVHLVDLGLITPLRSAMTLTTHGTEYFRDPELVRLALRGVKVHEVDGVKFDIYGAGAVLYSMIENSFPAHGSLSQITRRCPEALRWIVRRAMADMGKRYASSVEMLADLEALRQASDAFAFTPAQLPSMRAAAHDPLAAGAPGAADDAVPVAGLGAAVGAGSAPRRTPGTPSPFGPGSASSATSRGEPRKVAGRGRSNPGLVWGAVAACVVVLGALVFVPVTARSTGNFTEAESLVDSIRMMVAKASPPAPNAPRRGPPVANRSGRFHTAQSGSSLSPAAAAAAAAPPTDGMPRPADARAPAAGVPVPAMIVAPLPSWRRGGTSPHRLLVLDDLPEATAGSPAVQALWTSLETTGYVLVSDDREHDLGEDAAIDLLAQARSAVGVNRVHSADAAVIARLTGVLAGAHDTLHGVLWVGLGKERDHLGVRAFVLDGADVETLTHVLSTGSAHVHSTVEIVDCRPER